MKTVSRKEFERKCLEGTWEVQTDENEFGRVRVFSWRSKKFFMVTVK